MLVDEVAVVIPYYNNSRDIFECLDSIDNQDFSGKLNVYIIDDCSDDSAALIEIINNYKFKKIRVNYFRCSTCGGGGNARNIGIEQVSEKYIALMDADDKWISNKISHQIKSYCERTILTSAVLKGSDLYKAVCLPKYCKSVDEKISDSLFIHNRLIQTSTFFMSSDIAKKIKFNPSLPRHQDYDFLLRAEAAGYPIIQDEQPLSFWRVEDASTNRFIKKKATPEFFINWFGEYRKYMTADAAIAYVSKNIFSACMITKKYSLFNDFYFSDAFSILERCKIIVGIVSWRMKKIRDDK
ncbi:glycosyltransferase family 2 protein [Aeromonas veronii]|uniref:glycosyltransferase family 2 protein n=1 Tax=Aeromonas veronii TaxID=654 RepID=UPI0021637913|nr:glycosyltransferase family 2 protein [Aeromonas veronii]